MKDELKHIHPAYEDNLCLDTCSDNILSYEIKQCEEEGLDIDAYLPTIRAAIDLPAGEVKRQIADALFLAIENAKVREGYKYDEPSDYESILALRPGDYKFGKIPAKATLEEKISGAWMGRICGCMLGKTVEGIRVAELVPLLRETGNYPMHRYILRSDMSEEVYAKYKYPLRERDYIDEWDGMPADDDTNYLVLAQNMITKKGVDFTPADMANEWLVSQPKSAYFTAEAVAFANFMRGYMPPDSATYHNPYREWIGAQIRGDYFGYINAGNPEAAAKMAYKDACISHTKNGIYGEMWASAMIATAAVEDDMPKIIRGGLGQIPHTSRLYEAIEGVISDFEKGVKYEEVIAKMTAAYDEYTTHGAVHTISNAIIVAAALLYGGGDYGKTICLAVQTGYDTDCNGATVGSVLGMRNGIGGIGDEWKKPIGDKLHTHLSSMPVVSISACVAKTIGHIGLVRSAKKKK